MKGIILLNAYSDIPPARRQSLRLKEEFARLGTNVEIARNNRFFARINSGGEIDSRLGDFSFCVYLDKDKYVSYMLEMAGVKLFNGARAIELCDDKMTTQIALAGAGIPMPKTLPGLLCYDQNAKTDLDAMRVAEKELGYPLIVKSSFGSMGAGVYKADNFGELVAAAENLKTTPHLFQQYVAESAGKDIRVIVIGGKAVAAMERRSDKDFRSNIAAGGRGVKIDLPEEARRLAERAAALLGLDYCGADILFGKDKFYLCEVNSNAFFEGIEGVTGINVGRLYAEHILSRL